jgi:methylenetetrahydrofolate reductase (NADH)
MTTDATKSGSNLETVLRAGAFAVTAELGPPKNADAEAVRAKARILKGFADAANITDNQTAIVRMSSIAAGVLAYQEGLEPVIQITCRDRNRLAMQSDVLGAYALGLRNVLCLSGDHQSLGNHKQAKNVYDIDSMQLVQMVAELRDAKRFQCGEEIKGTNPRFFVGAAENPFADPVDWRPYRLSKKVKAGADFIQTQMIFNVPRFRNFMKRVVDLGIHEKAYILAGIGPLKSLGMAKHMREHVPGMDIPDEIVRRVEAAGNGIEDKAKRSAALQEEGIKISVELIQQVQEIEGVAGIHLMAIEWEKAVPVIAERAGLLPRPQRKSEALKEAS